jgi:hypothetical protein
MRPTTAHSRSTKPHKPVQLKTPAAVSSAFNNEASLREALNEPIPLPSSQHVPFDTQPGVAVRPAEMGVVWSPNFKLTNVEIVSRARSFRGQTPAELYFDEAEREFMRIVGDHITSTMPTTTTATTNASATTSNTSPSSSPSASSIGNSQPGMPRNRPAARVRVKGVAVINNEWHREQFVATKEKFTREGKPSQFVWAAILCSSDAEVETLVEIGYSVPGLGLSKEPNIVLLADRPEVDLTAQMQEYRTVVLVKLLPGRVSRIKPKNAINGFDSFQQPQGNWIAPFFSNQVLCVYVVKW